MTKLPGRIELNLYDVFVLGGDPDSEALSARIKEILLPTSGQEGAQREEAKKIRVYVHDPELETEPEPSSQNVEFEEDVGLDADARLTIRNHSVWERIEKHDKSVRLHFRLGEACWVLKYNDKRPPNSMCGCEFEP